jgi:hypothetical protein
MGFPFAAISSAHTMSKRRGRSMSGSPNDDGGPEIIYAMITVVIAIGIMIYFII